MGSKRSKTGGFYPSCIYEKFLKKCLKSKKNVFCSKVQTGHFTPFTPHVFCNHCIQRVIEGGK